MHIVYAVKGIRVCVRAVRFGILGHILVARHATLGRVHYLDVLPRLENAHTNVSAWPPFTHAHAHTHTDTHVVCKCAAGNVHVHFYVLILFSVVAVAVAIAATVAEAVVAVVVAGDLRRTHFHVLLFVCWEFLFVCYPTIFIAHS